MGGDRSKVPNDPGRRDRILEATLNVIAAEGVSATTHRKIAERAGVPLGSMTYYFSSLTEILEQAFAKLSGEMADYYRSRLEGATSSEQAEEAVVDLICGTSYVDHRRVGLLFEMFAFANRNDATRVRSAEWLTISRASLSNYFGPDAARAIDALVEAWPMHGFFEGSPPDRDLVTRSVRALAAALD